MGGLFSSNKNQPRYPQPQIERSTLRTTYPTDSRYEVPIKIHRTTYSREQENFNVFSYKKTVPQITEQSLCNDFGHLSIRPSYIKKVQVNKLLIKELAASVGLSDSWYSQTNNEAFFTEILSNESREYQHVAALFMSTNKKCFQIQDIKKIYNVYLYLQFKLKERVYARRLRFTTTQNLFHGTKICNITGICENNFNWRLRGTALGHRFGQGVSFTNISNYATHYGDLKSFSKVMILAQVLIGHTCIGNASMMIPDKPFDTATNNKQQVLVKFEDNEFYPCYVIHYIGFDPMRKR